MLIYNTYQLHNYPSYIQLCVQQTQWSHNATYFVDHVAFTKKPNYDEEILQDISMPSPMARSLAVVVLSMQTLEHLLNTLRPRQNGCHFTDNIFQCIFLNENVWIFNIIWLKFVPKGPIDNITALVQLMAWRRIGDKPLSEPMMA